MTISATSPGEANSGVRSGFNVLYCHNRYQQRSGEDVAFDFALNLLRQSGHQVSVYSRSNDEIKEFNWIDKLAFPSNTVHSFRAHREVSAFVRDQGSEVALVQNVFPLLSPAVHHGLAAAKVPIVQLIFNYRLLCVNGLLFTQGNICERCVGGNYSHAVVHRCFRDSYMLSAIYAASLSFHRIRDTWKRCVTLFVTPDEFLKRKLVEAGFDGGRIRVVSNPFDASHCAPAFDRGNYALFVGRLIRPKGIFTLLDATLRTEGIRVVIAGDGEEAENVRKHEAVVSGRAVFIGPVYGEEFKRLIADAGFVIVPSEWYDNLPMIVCQAFAYGKPVLASRINGIPEFVKHELNGLLFDPGDSAGLAEAMDRAYHDISLRSRLARAARSTAEEVLSPYSWQRKMHEVLQEAIQMGTSQESD